LEKFGKRIPEAEIRDEMEALHIDVQAVMLLPSWRRDQDAEKNRPGTTLHSVVGAKL
jgi:hypothetical protein